MIIAFRIKLLCCILIGFGALFWLLIIHNALKTHKNLVNKARCFIYLNSRFLLLLEKAIIIPKSALINGKLASLQRTEKGECLRTI
jgi:hypothetical protein